MVNEPSKGSFTVDGQGTKLSYLDSGALASTSSYITFFAVHGWAYSNLVFKKVLELAPTRGIRFVAINRRGYAGSTALTTSELDVIANGTDTQKAAFLAARGCEIAKFIDCFIQHHVLPPASPDKTGGGVALLGWSIGNATSLAAISHFDLLLPEVQSRLRSHLQFLIINEPPPNALGVLPSPSQTQSSPVDWSTLGPNSDPMITKWLTSYFRHGDLSTRDPAVLSSRPSTSPIPTILQMSPEELASIVDFGPASSDLHFIANFGSLLLRSYQKACFDKAVRDALPHMKIWEVVGDASVPLALKAHWLLEGDNEANGGNIINFRVAKGMNHFMHWDEPEQSLKLYTELTL